MNKNLWPLIKRKDKTSVYQYSLSGLISWIISRIWMNRGILFLPHTSTHSSCGYPGLCFSAVSFLSLCYFTFFIIVFFFSLSISLSGSVSATESGCDPLVHLLPLRLDNHPAGKVWCKVQASIWSQLFGFAQWQYHPYKTRSITITTEIRFLVNSWALRLHSGSRIHWLLFKISEKTLIWIQILI